jgi:hypothetical protein
MPDKNHTYGTWVKHFGRAVFESLWRAMSSTLMKHRAILIFAVRMLATLASRWACHLPVPPIMLSRPHEIRRAEPVR